MKYATITPAIIKSEILEMRKDTVALKQLADLEELASVPTERGGYHFSEWERGFIKALCAMRDHEIPAFSQVQRDKLQEIWHAADLRERAAPDEKAQNLFSKLSPERQAEQRERAKRVLLPWEKP